MPTWGPNNTTTPTINVTGTSQQLATNTQYYANNPTTKIVFTLPSIANGGDKIYVRGVAAGLWRIAQNVNQIIHGSGDTTTGATGYIEAQTKTDCATLECWPTGNGTDWQIINQRGSLTSV